LSFNQCAWRNDSTQNSELQSRAINLLENPFIDNRAHKLRHSHTLSRVSCAVLRQLLLLLRHFRNEQFQRWRPSWMTTAIRGQGGKRGNGNGAGGACQWWWRQRRRLLPSVSSCMLHNNKTQTHTAVGSATGRYFLTDKDNLVECTGEGGKSRGIAPQAVLKASTQISSKV